VLDVEKGQLCYIVGTVYMDMPLKPNVMEDIARDVRILIKAFLRLGVLILGYPAIDSAPTASLKILFH
jgi:DNA polymerase delta subunit OB-fold domain